MWQKYLGYGVLILGIYLLQQSWLVNLPYLRYANLYIVIPTLALFIANKKTVALWYLGSALLLDLSSFQNFGLYLIIFFVIMLVSLLTLENFFTNKSLYPFILLVLLSTLFYDLYWHLILNWPAPLIINQNILLLEIKKLGVNLVLGLIIFTITTWLNLSLQSVILIKRKV